MKNKPSVVYIHRNKINNKAYIGITSKQNLNGRWHNGNGYSYNPHFWRAIQKYGWDGFDHEVFMVCETQEEAERVEKLLIKLFKTNDYRYGYNIADGGKGSPLSGEHNPFFGKVPTEAVKASVAKRIGVSLTEDHRQYISEGLKGKKKDKSHIEKYAAAQRGVKRGRKDIPLICIETGIKYNRIKDAADEMNVSASYMSYASKNNKKILGYTFQRLPISNDYP